MKLKSFEENPNQIVVQMPLIASEKDGHDEDSDDSDSDFEFEQSEHENLSFIFQFASEE